MTEKETDPPRIVVDFGHKPISADDVNAITDLYQDIHLNGARKKPAVKAFVQQTEKRVHDAWFDQFEANKRKWQATEDAKKKDEK